MNGQTQFERNIQILRSMGRTHSIAKDILICDQIRKFILYSSRYFSQPISIDEWRHIYTEWQNDQNEASKGFAIRLSIIDLPPEAWAYMMYELTFMRQLINDILDGKVISQDYWEAMHIYETLLGEWIMNLPLAVYYQLYDVVRHTHPKGNYFRQFIEQSIATSTVDTNIDQSLRMLL